MKFQIKTNSLNFQLKNAVIKEYPELENIEITPSKEQQIYKSENYYGYDEVKVNGVTSEIDNNIKPENIKEGVSILGVSGNVEEINATEVRINPTSEEQTIIPEEPYNGFNKVIVGAQSGVNPEEFFDTTINSSNASYFASRNMIKKLPKIELDSSATNLSAAFFQLAKITSIPLLDTSNITNMSDMVNGCSSLVDFPLLNTSNVTTMSGLFSGCSSIKNIPLLNTSKVTNMQAFVASCSKLENLPLLDTSKATTMVSMCSNCRALKSFPQFDTSNVTNMNNMLTQCTALESVAKLNCSKVNSIYGILLGGPRNNLTYLGGFENLGEAYLTTRAENYFYYTLDLSYCTALTHESLMNVINGLYDIATKGCKPQKLTLGSTNLAKLTEEEIAIATNKGWNVS